MSSILNLTPDSLPAERMQCMEVWGGNQQASKHLEMPGLEAWVFCQPHQEADGGGDIYYVSSCASGRITRILLADVSGHGDDAAEPASILRKLMRRHINFISQTRFVREMNREFGRWSESARFATALVCSYFCPTCSFSLCNAGHPEPLMYRKSTNSWSAVKQDAVQQDVISDTPLGISDAAEYSQTEVRLTAGDMVLCFSDALPESVDSDGRQLGTAGIHRIVQSLDASAPAALIPALCREISACNPENFFHDDTTVLLLRGTESRPALKDTLLAPLRLFGPVRDHTTFLPQR